MASMTSAGRVERARRTYEARRPVRRALRRGELSIATVMREQPDAFSDYTLFEVLLMAHMVGRTRLRTLNAAAVEAGVNLAVTLRLADVETREWVARNALPHGRSRPLDLWAQLMDDASPPGAL